MKILKLSQNFFVDILWKISSPQKNIYSSEFKCLAKEYTFIGFYSKSKKEEPTRSYDLSLIISKDGNYKINIVDVISNSLLINKVTKDKEEFKRILSQMNIPVEKLGINEFHLSYEPKAYRLTKEDGEPRELVIKLVKISEDKCGISYKISNINDGKVIIDSFYADPTGKVEFSFEEGDVLARRIAKTAVTKQNYKMPSEQGYIKSSSSKRMVVAQDFGGYYSGQIPEYQGSYIGSPSVDISNVSSQFGDAQKSVDLVNRFDSSLLKNIVYMFNFSKSGVYGVYVPALDRAVKTKELEKRLKSMGYDIVEENGMLRAYPTKEEKDQETIQKEIQTVYNDLESKGGSVLGLNVGDTRREMEGSFNNIKDSVSPERHSELRNDLMIAHMAATMAHEATHAHGAEDEGGPTQVETALLSSAMVEIAKKYGIEGELHLKRGATNNWYKVAQSNEFGDESNFDVDGYSNLFDEVMKVPREVPKPKAKFESYSDFANFARRNWIFTGTAWRSLYKNNLVKLRKRFPKDPESHYEGFSWDYIREGFGNFNSPEGRKKELSSYDEFIDFARAHEVYTTQDWQKFRESYENTKLVTYFPSNPWEWYEGFNWDHIKPEGFNNSYMEYKDFILFAKKNELFTQNSIMEFRKNHPELANKIPSNPWHCFEKGYDKFDWKDIRPDDWKWKSKNSTDSKMSYEEFVEFAKENNLLTDEKIADFIRSGKKPSRMPSSPLRKYRNQFDWKDIRGDFVPKKGRQYKTQSSSNWYKTAQQHVPFYAPSGSDLTGRHGGWSGNLQGQSDWSMLTRQNQNLPLELMLDRRNQFPLPKGLSQEHDSLELQLRKNTVDDWKLDPNLIFEELLREGRTDDGAGYKTLEQLLEDQRPHPLMRPIKKASKISKYATVFGWYNNLEISDGSTIPGMGDRVMAWDDRDECFSQEEDWIKAQPRYNPEYDIKGFYYRYIDPRLKPELWDTSVRDLANTSPAKRFAQKNGLGFIIDSLRKLRTHILQGKIKATRLICSEDILKIVEKSMSNAVSIGIFKIGEKDNEVVYSCWLYKDIDVNEIEKIEQAIQDKDEKCSELMSKLIGCKSTLSESVDEIMSVAKDVAEDYELYDVYSIGAYARERSFGDKTPEVEELDFTSDSPTNCLKMGYLIAEKLGEKAKLNKKNKYLSFNYKGIPVYFNGGDRSSFIEENMSNSGIETHSNIMHDICNKDFTINMQAYSPASGVVTSVFGNEKVIKTLFDADTIVSLNPFIILRAIYLSVRYHLPIDQELDKAIFKYTETLSEKYPIEMLQFAKNKIESLGKEEAQSIFKKYELDNILDFGE